MKNRIYIWLAILSLALAGCVNEPTTSVGKSMQIAVPSTDWQEGRVITRAASRTDLLPPQPIRPDSIGIFAYRDTNSLANLSADFTYQNIPFYYKDTIWHANHYEPAADTAYEWANSTFQVYGYSPYREGDVRGGIHQRTKIVASLDTLQWINVPELDTIDRCVAHKVRTFYPNLYHPCVLFSTATETQFDHIYACIRFAFALDKEYSKLRYIHIKEIAIRHFGDSYREATVTRLISANQNTWSHESTGEKFGDYYLPVRADLYLGKEAANTDKYVLGGEFYTRPRRNSEVGTFQIRVCYDVYDRTGQITREDVYIESEMAFSNTNFTGDSKPGGVATFLAGYYYNVFVRINPDFLFSLSDNDEPADVELHE